MVTVAFFLRGASPEVFRLSHSCRAQPHASPTGLSRMRRASSSLHTAYTEQPLFIEKHLPQRLRSKPSTSFSGAILCITCFSSSPLGRGSCIRIPCTFLSLLRSSTSLSRSCCVVVSDILWAMLIIPSSAQVFSFDATYFFEAGFSPTRTTARQGSIPFAFTLAILFQAFPDIG